MLEGTLFTVVNQCTKAQSADFDVRLNAEHPIYGGHFPGDAVTPGVCILQIACDLMEKTQNAPLFIQTLKNVKFMKVIRPNEVQNVRFHFDWTVNPDDLSVKCLVDSDITVFAKINFTLKKR